jgi:hypothetical protein
MVSQGTALQLSSEKAKPTPNPVRAALDSVAEALVNCAPGQKDARTPIPVVQTDRPAVTLRIKKLEASIAAMPDDEDMMEQRQALQMKIDTAKASLVDVKPLGARIDAARLTLQRAEKRSLESANAVELAQACFASAQEEVTRLKTEIHVMESSLASVPCAPPPSSVEEAMLQLSGAMNVIMCSIAADKLVSEDLASEASSHSNHLLVGLQGTLQAAAEARLEAGPSRRITGKSTNNVEQVALDTQMQLPLLHRARGKQEAPKRTIGELFSKARKASRANRFQDLEDDGNMTA